MRSPLVASLAVLASLLALVALAAPAPLFRAAPPWSLGGEGGWDYVTADAAARRLYVSHGTRVEVLDLRSRQKIGVIEPTPGVHGVALAPDLGRGFVSCGRDSSMVVFELATLHTLQRVALPARNPDAILYEPRTHRVFTFNGGSANADHAHHRLFSVCDTSRTGATALLGNIDLGGKPEFAAADGAGKVATLPIGGGVDGVVFDQRRGLAISSNGEGTITVVRVPTYQRVSTRSPKPSAQPAESFVVAENDSTQRGARTVALDDSTGTLYLPAADFGPPPSPTPDRPRPRPSIVPDTFRLLIYQP